MEQPPYDSAEQRALTRDWTRVAEGRAARGDNTVRDLTSGAFNVETGVMRTTPSSLERAFHASLEHSRALVRDSWLRSVEAAVPADLPKAPLVLADAGLAAARERADWVPLALRAAEQLSEAFTNGHILSLFDAEGRMLSCDGDRAVIEGLASINFRPGGLWTESAVGTNGPGTALATRRAVHIVGAEHYCEAWHGWHCAAVPIADTVTHELLGVVDISGFSRNAHPHTLQLAVSLASSVHEMLGAREIEHRYAVLQRYLQMSVRYASDALIAVDRHGRVLHATAAVPAGMRPGTEMPHALQRAIAEHVRACSALGLAGECTEVFLALDRDIGLSAMSYPVFDGARAVGACILFPMGTAVGDARALTTARSATMRPADTRHALAGGRARNTPAVAPARVAPVARAGHYALADIIGNSAPLAEAMRIARAAARNTLPVLLVGESGTGKEVFAQAIHSASARAEQPFIAVNCAALPRDLIESELFGYVGGAFTGARREGSPGKFRAAQGGTIFLDEISEMSHAAQASLLRVLQEQEVSSVGSSETEPLNVRVIAATNRNIAEAVDAGQLRADLYYRLNVLAIELSPLRERAGDIPLLAEQLLAMAAVELDRPALRFGAGVVDVLMQHDWPGNVRELKNTVRRMAALAVSDTVGADALPSTLRSVTQGDVRPTSSSGDAVAHDDERTRTIAAMSDARSMRDAAAKLGINRSTLYRRLERYGLAAHRKLSVPRA